MNAAPAKRRQRSAEPELYDFRRPMTLAREHARILEVAMETFARQWGTLLTSRTRVVAQIALDGVELRTYDEYIRPLPSTSLMILCGVEPARATGVLQLPVDAGMVWVDYLLGGPGQPIGPADREMTEIEWQLLRELVQTGLHELAYAFTSVTRLELTAKSVQYAPQFVQAAAAQETVLVATFVIELGNRHDEATLMLPADAVLAALREADGTDARTPDELRDHDAAVRALSAQVRDVPVGVAVRFQPLTVTTDEIGELQVGDVIGLQHRSDTPLDVVVDDVVLAKAAIGSNGKRLACLVVAADRKEH
ncbi:FliM/FliN family flagellar motor switch protein [Isoptericola sp. b441]|uniref:Flagellar motor switch protein FliM n=1 Tax=Actinotalea lenta TaxID=3064654 RepID=A0ABT9D5N0_9CELL|nr:MULTISPECIES: FliM/FliN family flagellar motor switch protein [unclassified Isoptericola]MDO8106110.1 FliM/FliN family flagellar motor switch protein [Isoptericola sp. b441]MDO8122171.1 FliM/FliN family flagellar motor switch protein [Isoptericola sp. b490]